METRRHPSGTWWANTHCFFTVIEVAQHCPENRRLTPRLGPIVRISPHELHINDPFFSEDLYSFKGRLDRYTGAAKHFGMDDVRAFAAPLFPSVPFLGLKFAPRAFSQLEDLTQCCKAVPFNMFKCFPAECTLVLSSNSCRLTCPTYRLRCLQYLMTRTRSAERLWHHSSREMSSCQPSMRKWFKIKWRSYVLDFSKCKALSNLSI